MLPGISLSELILEPFPIALIHNRTYRALEQGITTEWIATASGERDGGRQYFFGSMLGHAVSFDPTYAAWEFHGDDLILNVPAIGTYTFYGAKPSA